MTSQSKPPPEPVGIELLLELLNASEGPVDRNAPPPDVTEDSLEAKLPEAMLPTEPQILPPVSDQNDSAQAEQNEDLEARHSGHESDPTELAGDYHPDVTDAEDSEDTAENRFAAHVVRGMSKSKIR
jgi:hypothetical protein